jgi:hypothetical protein
VQDIVFGSEGTAQADFERQEEINREIGLTRLVMGSGGHTPPHEPEKDHKYETAEHV